MNSFIKTYSSIIVIIIIQTSNLTIQPGFAD